MKRYFFIGSGSSSCRRMMLDLENLELPNFEYILTPVDIENKNRRKIFDAYFRLNAKMRLPFWEMWKKFFTLPEFDLNDENYVILMNGVFNYYTSKYLNKLKEKFNLHYIIVIIDPLSGFPSEFMRKQLFETKYDLLYSFDSDDAKNIKAIHTMALYSKLPMKQKLNGGGVYFAGTNKKNRVETIQKIYTRFVSEQIKCKFRITNVSYVEQYEEGIIYNEPINYERILEEIQECDSILEIVQPGQVGVTLRYYEAICYNKKLITNNQFVKTLPFYNPEYMYVFENPDEIDLDWVKRNIDIDYYYGDEFSPKRLLEDIYRRTR